VSEAIHVRRSEEHSLDGTMNSLLFSVCLTSLLSLCRIKELAAVVMPMVSSSPRDITYDMATEPNRQIPTPGFSFPPHFTS